MSGQLAAAPRCPFCGATLDGFTSADDLDLTPSAGDISICLYCCEVHVYDGDPLGIRKPAAHEAANLAADPELARMKAIARLARDQGGFEKRSRMQ